MSNNPRTGAQHHDGLHRPPTDRSNPIVDAVPADDELDEQIRAEHQSIPDRVREQVLTRDVCCQVDGCREPESDGSPGLLVQRIEDDPTHCSRDDPDNLVTRCPRCARWIAQMPSRDDLPPGLQTQLGNADIKSSRVEILEFLWNEGPAQTGEITEHVSLSSGVSVRRALYELMGLDIREPSVDSRLVAKDRVTAEYGLPSQIPEQRDARGVLPIQPESRRDRILDAFVERAFEALEDNVENPSELIAEIVDRDEAQTQRMRHRAQAFQFPFELWADSKRRRDDAAAVIEAVAVLASATDNASRRLVAQSLTDMLERNDEEELAAILEQYPAATNPAPSLVDDNSTGQPGDSQTDTSEHLALQVFGDSAGANGTTLRSVSEEEND
jgi:hypothetical protein